MRHAACFPGAVCAAATFALAAAGPAAAGNVSLSEVAEEAAKSPDEQKTLGREEPSQTKYKKEAPAPQPSPQEVAYASDSGTWYDVGVEIWHVLTSDDVPVESYPPMTGSRSSTSAPPPHSRAPRVRVGVTAGGGGLASDTLGGVGSGGILLGFGGESGSLDLRAQHTRGRFAEEHAHGFRDLHGWSVDGALRWRALPTSRGHVSLVFSGRLGNYDWEFANPVQVARPDRVDTVQRDSIRYRTLLAGLGLEPLKSAQWSVQLTAACGYQWFESITSHGFDNDVFEDGVVVEGRVEFVFSPRW